jgi:nucleoside-diphosphate-sugar epimerase
MAGTLSAWGGRKVLVTGCTGFLGGAVARELLDRGAEVVGVIEERSAGALFAKDRDAGRFHVVHGRLDNLFCVYTALAVHEVSAVFHLADEVDGPGKRDATAVLRAAALRDRELPVVAARPASDRPALGTISCGPAANGIVRFGEVFGPGDRRPAHLVPRTIGGLLAGERPSPASSAARDYVHVRDAARACLAVAEEVGSGTALDVALCSGWELTGEEMAEAIVSVFEGRAPEAAVKPARPNPFGWAPERPFEEALRETINWHRAHVAPSPRTPPRPLPWRRAA